jgi:MSHA biogenesis protein MshE
MLNELNTPSVKIITVEDPVEYRLPRITQVQVLPKIDLDFARVLRAALRQDPDIIMIGELRDQETAEIAIRAAMTGHFVFATLHTNDAVSSAERLLDMGVQGYLAATVLRAVIAQRLVRKICQNCFEDYTPTPQEDIWLSSIKGFAYNNKEFKHGVGCHYCNKTGYKGQIGVFELLIMNPKLANALRTENTEEFNAIAYSDKNYQTLAVNGLHLAVQGITTLSEVMRITGEVVVVEDEVAVEVA